MQARDQRLRASSAVSCLPIRRGIAPRRRPFCPRFPVFRVSDAGVEGEAARPAGFRSEGMEESRSVNRSSVIRELAAISAHPVVCDLHLHSDCSDGSLAVPELVRAVQAAGVSVFALTDHDTVDGLETARDAALALRLVQIHGVEISTRVDALELHILGYDFDPSHPALSSLLATQRDARRARIPVMLAKLARLGLTITAEEVEARAGGGLPGRPHVAEVLVAHGYVRNTEEAFQRYLADGAVAWVLRPVPGPREVIASIHAAGGKAVWAHPLARPIQRQGGFDQLARELRSEGLDGLEVVHPGHSPEARRRIRRAARELRLVLTGGSDFHGRLTPGIAIGRGHGEDEVPLSWVEALLA